MSKPAYTPATGMKTKLSISPMTIEESGGEVWLDKDGDGTLIRYALTLKEARELGELLIKAAAWLENKNNWGERSTRWAEANLEDVIKKEK